MPRRRERSDSMSSLTIDRPGRLSFACGLALWITLAANVVHAEPESFRSAYGAGKTALQAGAFQGALDHFRQSLREAGESQEATWKGTIGVAYAFRGLDQPGYALEYYRRFLAASSTHESMLPPKWRARRGAVQSEVAELETQALEAHALVLIATTPAGARMSIKGIPVGADGDAVTPYPIYLKPGEHTLTLLLAGYEDVQKTFTVAAGELVPMNITLSKPVVATPTPKAPPSAEPSPSPKEELAPIERHDLVEATDPSTLGAPEAKPGSNVGPYVMFGVGGAAALAAIGLTVGAAMKHQDYENRYRHYAKLDDNLKKALTGQQARAAVEELADLSRARDDMQLASNVLYGVGVATVVGGVIWMLVVEAPEASDSASGSAHLVPIFGLVPTADGAMTSATWRF